MSQGSSSVFTKEVLGASRQLSLPIGQNLTNTNTRTLIPTAGAIAYSSSSNTIYYGSSDTWNDLTGNMGATGMTGLGATGMTGLGATGMTGLGDTGNTGMTGSGYTGNTGMTGSGYTGNTGMTGSGYTGNTGMTGIGATGRTGMTGMTGTTGMTGIGATGRTGMTGLGATGNTGQPGITSVGPVSATSDPNAATITSQVLTLYSADSTNAGLMNVTGQSFSGIKTFLQGIILQTPVSAGVDNVLTKFCRGGNNPSTWSGGFSVVSPNVAVTLVDFVATFMPGNSIAGSGSNAIATLSPALQTELRPATANRGGIIPVMDNGVYKIGYFKVSMLGIVTVGIGLDSSQNLIPFTGGASITGVLDCAATYTIF